MPTFAEVADEIDRTPPASMIVQPSTFASTWDSRPVQEELVGLRPLSSDDMTYALGEAYRLAMRDHPHDSDKSGREIAYNENIMRLAIARGTCDPNDLTKAWEVWGGSPEDAVHYALTREGTKSLWDAIERVSIETSPVRAQIDDEDLARLARIVKATLARMPAARSARARRLFLFLLEECEAFEQPGDDPELEAEDAITS